MLPLADDNPTKNFSDVNYCIIGVNIIVFVFELMHWGPFATPAGVESLCMVPSRFITHFSLEQVGTLFSSMFMHAGFAHIIGNMWFLYIFGDNVEDRLGRFNYLLFYLACGIIGDLTTIIVEPTSTQGSLGASGAIAGVLGAYLVLFPGVQVKTWITWYLQPKVPAWVMIGLFYLMNLYSGIWGHDKSVGWFAHVGGMIAGIMLLKLVLGYAEKFNQSDQVERGPLSTFVALCIAFYGIVWVGIVAVPRLLANQKKPAVVEKQFAPAPKVPSIIDKPVEAAPKSQPHHKGHSGGNGHRHSAHSRSTAGSKTFPAAVSKTAPSAASKAAHAAASKTTPKAVSKTTPKAAGKHNVGSSEGHSEGASN